jgi:hypothetical protein
MEWRETLHPWVALIRDRVTFGLQVIGRVDEPEPGKQVVAELLPSGRRASASAAHPV